MGCLGDRGLGVWMGGNGGHAENWTDVQRHKIWRGKGGGVSRPASFPLTSPFDGSYQTLLR